MIYIKLDELMTLAITVNGPIYRGDHLAEKIVYLTPKKLNEIDMTGEARLYLSYIRADGTADIVLLNRTDKLYNETYCQFVVPVTCDLTKYPGEVCTWLTVFAESPDCCRPAVAKSGECMLRVMASKSMDAYLDDAKLTALYQMQHMIDENDPKKIERVDGGQASSEPAGDGGGEDQEPEIPDVEVDYTLDGGTPSGGNTIISKTDMPDVNRTDDGKIPVVIDGQWSVSTLDRAKL